jgi:CHAT domain-containing protein
LFQWQAGSVLHIAAHASFVLSEPELSFIQLGDGHLYADDLFQSDFCYQLVTLSACETGGVIAAPGDELIGLGHTFLYCGCDAVLASQWRVEDTHTDRLMNTLYDGLCQGKTKSAALVHAQRTLLAKQPHLHPALWGAWQLFGNARPLIFDNYEIETEIM